MVLTLEELDRAIDAKTRRSRCLDTARNACYEVLGVQK